MDLGADFLVFGVVFCDFLKYLGFKLKSRSHLLCAHYLCNVARVSKLGAFNVNGSFRIAKNLEPIRIEIFPKSAPVAPVESLILDQTPNPRILPDVMISRDNSRLCLTCKNQSYCTNNYLFLS